MMQHPQNLQEAYAMENLHDAIIKTQSRLHTHVNPSFPLGKQSQTSMGTLGNNIAVGNHVVVHRGVNVGNMNYADNKGTWLATIKEMEARRAKGLCYWCSKCYMINRACKWKHIFLIEVGEDEAVDTELEQGTRSQRSFLGY